MAVWLYEVHYDSLVLTPTTVTAAWDFTAPVAGIGLFIAFTDAAAAPQSITLQSLVYPHSFGGGPTYELLSVQRVFAPGFFDFITFGGVPAAGPTTLVAANGENGAAFLAGDRLTIQIDDGANTVVFTGPQGAISRTFTQMGWANGAITGTVLGRLGFLLEPSDNTLTYQFHLDFFNYYLSLSGGRIAGAQLGSLQPGSYTFAPWQLVNLGAPGGTITLANGTTETRLHGQLDWTTGVSNPGIFEAFLDWNPAATPQLKDVELVLSALRHPDEGTLLYARVTKQALDAIEVGYSRDKGHTWAQVLAGQHAGRAYNSPSLTPSPDGSLNLFASDRSGPVTRWFKSYSYGQDWIDAGLLLPVLPANITHPKVFTLANGFFLVHYNLTNHHYAAVFSGAGGTALSPAEDLGIPAGGFDVYPGIWQNDLGIVYLAWTETVLETQVRSFDNGVDWETVYSAATNAFQVVLAKDHDSPFLWKAFQDNMGNLVAQGSADAGITALATPATVFGTPLPNQYVGMAVLPLGSLVVIYQSLNGTSHLYDFHPQISHDLGVTWAPA